MNSEAFIAGYMSKEAGFNKEAMRGYQTRKLLDLLGIKDYHFIQGKKYPGMHISGGDIKNNIPLLFKDKPPSKEVLQVLKELKQRTGIEKINRPSLEDKLREARKLHGSAPHYMSPENKQEWANSLDEYLEDVTRTHNKHTDTVPKGERVVTQPFRSFDELSKTEAPKPVQPKIEVDEDGYW